jgi:Uma2 family endonuclease
MATQTLSYVDAVHQLPAGGTLILTDVPWSEYEQLLDDLGDHYSARITYDHGRLEIMSPSNRHETFNRLFTRLGQILSEELDLDIEDLGSTTYKQELLDAGVEPDTCFYVSNAARIIGNPRIDLAIDPPPDVVVEVDIHHESPRKFAIYAAMRVPEFWRYDGEQAHIYHLEGQTYVEAPTSLAFPILTSEALTRFLDQSATEGQSPALRSFRQWLRAQKIVVFNQPL